MSRGGVEIHSCFVKDANVPDEFTAVVILEQILKNENNCISAIKDGEVMMQPVGKRKRYGANGINLCLLHICFRNP